MAKQKPGPLALPRPRMVPMAPETIHFPYQDDRPETTGTGHLHWGITAFTKLGEDGVMHDSVSLEVEAPDEETAIARAQEILVRNYYRVSWVREACSVDKDLRDGN